MRHCLTPFSISTVALAAMVLISPPGLSAKRKTEKFEKRDLPAIIRLQTIPSGCSVFVGRRDSGLVTVEGKWLEIQCDSGRQYVIVANDSIDISFSVVATSEHPVLAIANLRDGRVYAGYSRDQIDSIPCRVSPPLSGGSPDRYPCDSTDLTEEPLPSRTAVTDSLPSVGEFVPVEVQPEIISEVKPNYPLEAKQAGIAGTVWVMALIDKEGNVRCSHVAKTSGFKVLDASAVAAAYKCKYKPGYQNGQPVACWVTYPVKFALKGL